MTRLDESSLAHRVAGPEVRSRSWAALYDGRVESFGGATSRKRNSSLESWG